MANHPDPATAGQAVAELLASRRPTQSATRSVVESKRLVHPSGLVEIPPKAIFFPSWKREAQQITAPGLRELLFGKALAGKVKWPLFLHGGIGGGKTRASLCLVDAVENSQFWIFSMFSNKTRRISNGDKVTDTLKVFHDDGRRESEVKTWNEETWWDWVGSRPLVVLDEIGLRERANDSTYDAMKLLLDFRDGRPTILTSNLPLLSPGKDKDGRDLPSLDACFDGRIIDRLAAGTMFEVVGESKR